MGIIIMGIFIMNVQRDSFIYTTVSRPD